MGLLEPYLTKPIQCACGRTHFVPISRLDCDMWKSDFSGNAAELLHGKRALLICDAHTHEVINKRLIDYLKENGWNLTVREYHQDSLVNNEQVVGTAVFDMTPETDGIIAVGGGTITDLGRFVASRLGKPFVLVMTCPSMDGYASNVAGMMIDGKKRVLKNCQYPSGVFGDLEVLRNAPMDLIRSGYGDMLGKRTAILDWILAHSQNGDFYCELTANLVLESIDWCDDIDAIDALMARDDDRVRILTESLLTTGVNMALCEDTRPASGSEHIFSHYLVEKAIEAGRKPPSHGASVGFGTLVSTLLYEYLLEKTAPAELVPISQELNSRLLHSDSVYKLLELSGIGGKLSDYLADGDELATMIHACSGPEKRYTILRYLQKRELLEPAIGFVRSNMEKRR